MIAACMRRLALEDHMLDYSIMKPEGILVLV